MGKGANLPESNPDLSGLDETELATNQQAIPLPWWCGTQTLKANWVSPACDEYCTTTMVAVPGKKG